MSTLTHLLSSTVCVQCNGVFVRAGIQHQHLNAVMREVNIQPIKMSPISDNFNFTVRQRKVRWIPKDSFLKYVLIAKLSAVLFNLQTTCSYSLESSLISPAVCFYIFVISDLRMVFHGH